ncbi:DUF3267 domain-containing protein [Methanolobus sp. ZRKC3]|uniref:DUF3267 domain-containing protein n=1 Tax=Methanolobus sp. ZRKC3 TaxID=3125786 RepID=UPI00324CD56A
MQIRNKIPETDLEKHLELINSHWNQLKEPQNLMNAILLSIPIMFLNALITIGIIQVVSPSSLTDINISLRSLSITIDLYDIVGLILLLMIHELLHLIFIPNFTKSNNTYIGITPFGGFVYTEDKLLRLRYIIVTIAPFILISIIAPIILGNMGLLTPFIIFLILLNSMASSVDILIFILILFQVPSNSYLRSNGMNTYWKIVQ